MSLVSAMLLHEGLCAFLINYLSRYGSHGSAILIWIVINFDKLVEDTGAPAPLWRIG